LNIRASKSEAWTIVPEDHIYAAAQFELPSGADVSSSTDGFGMDVLEKNTEGEFLNVAGKDFRVQFNLVSGRLTSFLYKEKELILKGPQPDFWRPPTDNDYGYNMDRRLGVWKKAGENSKMNKTEIGQPSPGVVVVKFRYDIFDNEGGKIALWSTDYTIHSSSDVIVKNSMEKLSDAIPEIPRMGMQLQLPEELSNLKWYGRGPHENYSDRKTSADVGLYVSTVSDMYTPYIRPQENGYRTDTRWLTLTDDNGTGILVRGSPFICFAALHNVHDDFESPGKLSVYRKDAKSANTHTNDVKPRELVNLNVDMGQMGVGGDDSWGAPIHKEYRLTDRKYTYTFSMRPIAREDDILKLSKEKK
jgi:beta-galactosidase